MNKIKFFEGNANALKKPAKIRNGMAGKKTWANRVDYWPPFLIKRFGRAVFSLRVAYRPPVWRADRAMFWAKPLVAASSKLLIYPLCEGEAILQNLQRSPKLAITKSAVNRSEF